MNVKETRIMGGTVIESQTKKKGESGCDTYVTNKSIRKRDATNNEK